MYIRILCQWLHAGNLLAKCLSNNWCHFSFSYDGFSYCVQTGCFNWYLSQIPLQFAAINSFWSLLRVDVWLESDSSWLESDSPLTRVRNSDSSWAKCHPYFRDSYSADFMVSLINHIGCTRIRRRSGAINSTAASKLPLPLSTNSQANRMYVCVAAVTPHI